MFSNTAVLTVPNTVVSILEKTLNAEDKQLMYEDFMVQCFLAFEKTLKKKITSHGERAIINNKYYSKFSKSFRVPNCDLVVKYTANVRWTDSYGSKTLSPSVTGVDVCIPSLRGKTFIYLKDYVDRATFNVIQREILGGF